MLTKIPHPDYSSHPAYGQFFGNPTFTNRLRALKRFLPQFLRQARAIAKYYARGLVIKKPEVKDNRSLDILSDLTHNGVVAIKLSASELSAISEGLQKYIVELEDHKAQTPVAKRKFRDKVLPIPKSDSDLYSIVRNILADHNILGIAGAYRKRPFIMTRLYLQISDPDDPDWKDHFADAGVSDPKTAYMHRDSSIRWMKGLIYLTEVNMENGPTSYVLGSNNFKNGLWEYIVHKANDKSDLDRCDLGTREVFGALPKMFQKKAEFGNDLLDSTPEVAALLAAEKHFTSDDGNLFLFDSDGIHRGGMLTQGKRRILQVVLEPKRRA